MLDKWDKWDWEENDMMNERAVSSSEARKEHGAAEPSNQIIDTQRRLVPTQPLTEIAEMVFSWMEENQLTHSSAANNLRISHWALTAIFGCKPVENLVWLRIAKVFTEITFKES